MRLLRWFLFLAVLGGLGYAGWRGLGEWWRKATAPRYLVAAVTRGRVEHSVNSTGTVKAVQTVNVGSFVSGPILQVFVKFNEEVTKGQPLATIDPILLQAALDRDEAALAREKAVLEREKATQATQEAERDRVKALLDQALANEGRAKRLRQTNKDYISQNELDQFEAATKSLQAQLKLAEAMIRQAGAAVSAAAQSVKQSEANLKNSRANRGYCDIKSPEDGVVIERKVDPGQTVASAFQTPEMFILAKDLYKTVHVHASVDEADIGQVLAGQARQRPARFTVDSYPETVFESKSYEVRKNATTTQNVVTYPVVIEASNAERKLFPGMTANISFEIEVKEKALRVPASALRFVPPSARVRDEDRKHLDATPAGADAPKLSAAQKAAASKSRSRRVVWVEGEGGRLRAVPLVLGLIDSQYAEVLEGDLKDGDEVVTGIDVSRGR